MMLVGGWGWLGFDGTDSDFIQNHNKMERTNKKKEDIIEWNQPYNQ